PPLRSYSGQPQRALRGIVRRRDRRDETARRFAKSVHGCRRRPDKTDRDDLRLRRFRGGPDAGAVSAWRARYRALSRLLGGMGFARRTGGRKWSRLVNKPSLVSCRRPLGACSSERVGTL